MTSVLVPGLCSVTLRALDVRAVADHAAAAGLKAIEWGGDVHVPPGDIAAARQARTICDDLGLHVASYGSYLAAGRATDADERRLVLDTACELGAPNIRVWAHGDDAAPDLATICTAAAERDLTVSLEFHPGTSTETAASTNRLLDEVAAPNLSTYWQPDPSLDPTAMPGELEAVLPRLSHLHVFWWEADYTRLPLIDGEGLWPRLLRTAAPREGSPQRIAFLEFVRNDDADQLRRDAEALVGWISAT